MSVMMCNANRHIHQFQLLFPAAVQDCRVDLQRLSTYKHYKLVVYTEYNPLWTSEHGQEDDEHAERKRLKMQ